MGHGQVDLLLSSLPFARTTVKSPQRMVRYSYGVAVAHYMATKNRILIRCIEKHGSRGEPAGKGESACALS